jgi:3-hydroxymyristoyl/3-hydroxydecanoyl-(acyl carrier protein) dehydratase
MVLVGGCGKGKRFMRFLFVSRIQDITGEKIKGQVDFSAGEPWRRITSENKTEISTSVVSEAVGQLVSWMALRDNKFTGRPVFLFASQIDLSGIIHAPGTVDLEAWISNRSEDSFIFSGTAKVDGKTVVEIKECGGYFMPLAELEDPTVTSKRFETLSAGGLPANPAGEAFNFAGLVDQVMEIDPGKSIKTAKVMKTTEPFYADHFPRFPVTPIVVINEMIAEATRCMMTKDSAKPAIIHPIAVQDLKIKSFIRPGDTAIIQSKVTETNGNEFETVSEILVNEKRILRGRYRYRQSQ